MQAHDPSSFLCRQVKDPTLAIRGQIGNDIADMKPIRMLQMKGVEHHMRDAQQELTTGRRRRRLRGPVAGMTPTPGAISDSCSTRIVLPRWGSVFTCACPLV